LFYAFGFLKERTKGAGQLFILTHNFTFFRQIKNWLNYINKNKRAFYLLECDYIDGRRTAVLRALDKLLYKYESEYQYLFSVIYEISQKDDKGLEQYYHIPNIARRLLEAFLAFRQPSSKTLHKKLEDIDYDAAKKARIYRFVHTHSHSEYVEDGSDHDMSILSETPSVLKDLLGLIESEDKKHYEQMVHIVVDDMTDT
jgi:wobble nucleotide-excising tRNase